MLAILQITKPHLSPYVSPGYFLLCGKMHTVVFRASNLNNLSCKGTSLSQKLVKGKFSMGQTESHSSI